MFRFFVIISFLFSCSDDFKNKKIYQISILRKLLQSSTITSFNPLSQTPTQTPNPTTTSTPDPSLNYKYLFITTISHNGDFFNDAALSINGATTGISKMDQFCRTEKINNFSTLPGESLEYKAFAIDGVNRIACTTGNCNGGTSEHLDWVLNVATDYYSQSKVKIFTTSASSGIINNLDQILDSTGLEFWTGLNNNYTTGLRCSNWNSPLGAFTARTGIGNTTFKDDFISKQSTFCNLTRRVLCVRQ